MKLKVTLDHNGFIPDQYAKFAPDNYRYDGMPTVNFPVIITDIPKNAQSLSVSLIDYDAVPVGGFPWIHWLAANLPVTNIPEHLKAHHQKCYLWYKFHLARCQNESGPRKSRN